MVSQAERSGKAVLLLQRMALAPGLLVDHEVELVQARRAAPSRTAEVLRVVQLPAHTVTDRVRARRVV